MKKRWLSLLLAVILCVGTMPAALAADTVLVVTPSAQTAAAGDTVTVNVELRGNPGVTSVQFALTYDASVLTCTGGTVGSALKGALAAVNPDKPGSAFLAAASAAPLTQDGVLATFTFRAEKAGKLRFGVTDEVLYDASGMAFSVSLEGADRGPVTPSGGEQSGTSGSSSGGGQSGTSAPPAETKPAFTDTAGHWAESYIQTAVDRGYFQGYEDGTFRPGGKVTRGAFVTVLWRMAGRPQPAGETPFTDTVGMSEEFRTAIAWAYGRGYINGRTASTFAPGAPVTRQEAMKILYYFAGGVSGLETAWTQTYDETYTDSGALASWAKAPVYWGIYNGLLSGTSATTLSPTGEANRAQLAKILVNYADKIGVQ